MQTNPQYMIERAAINKAAAEIHDKAQRNTEAHFYAERGASWGWIVEQAQFVKQFHKERRRITKL